MAVMWVCCIIWFEYNIYNEHDIGRTSHSIGEFLIKSKISIHISAITAT